MKEFFEKSHTIREEAEMRLRMLGCGEEVINLYRNGDIPCTYGKMFEGKYPDPEGLRDFVYGEPYYVFSNSGWGELYIYVLYVPEYEGDWEAEKELIKNGEIHIMSIDEDECKMQVEKARIGVRDGHLLLEEIKN